MKRADPQQQDVVCWSCEGHGGGDLMESSRTLQVKALHHSGGIPAFSSSFFCYSLESRLILLTECCSVTAGPGDR